MQALGLNSPFNQRILSDEIISTTAQTRLCSIISMPNPPISISRAKQILSRLGDQFKSKYDIDNIEIFQHCRATLFLIKRNTEAKEKCVLKILPHPAKAKNSEASFLEKLNSPPSHQSIITLYDSYSILHEKQHYDVLCLEQWGQSLSQYIYDLKGGNKNEIVVGLAKKIVDAMCYVHSKQILHLDLKLQNILIKDQVIKLIDFGESLQSPFERQLQHCVTQRYCPPEILQSLKQNAEIKIVYDYTYDVWSFGMICHEMLEMLQEKWDGKKAKAPGRDQVDCLEDGRKRIVEWSKKQQSERKRGESKLLFDLFKKVFTAGKRSTFEEMQKQILQSKQTEMQSNTRNNQFRSVTPRQISIIEDRSAPKYLDSKFSRTPKNWPVKKYVEYVLWKVEIADDMLENVMDDDFVLYQSLSHLDRFLLQLFYLSILCKQHKIVQQLSTGKTVQLPNGEIVKIRDPNEVSAQILFKQHLEPLFVEHGKKYQEFIELMQPNVQKSKKLLRILKKEDNSNAMESVRQVVERMKTVEQLSSLDGERGMRSLLRNIKMLKDKDNLKWLQQLYKLSVIGNLSGVFPENEFSDNTEKEEKYRKNMKERDSSVLREEIKINLNDSEMKYYRGRKIRRQY